MVLDMGRIDVLLPDVLEKRLREEVFRRKGLRRGNLTEALQEAVTLWLDSSST